jgi:hypothetical protein
MTTNESNYRCKITPEMFWQFRRAQLDGKSAITGEPLPEKLEGCPPAVQADHYAQACYALANYCVASDPNTQCSPEELRDVPIPSGVSSLAGYQIRSTTIMQMLKDHGAA